MVRSRVPSACPTPTTISSRREPLWATPSTSGNDATSYNQIGLPSSPAVAGNVVYYGTSGGFLNAADIADGKLRARFQTDGSRETAARLLDAKRRLHTKLMYPDRTLDGLMTGMRTMMTLGSVLSSPVVADGVVYFDRSDGQLYAVR